MMTFEQFRGSREETDDVAATLHELDLAYYDGKQPALVYCRQGGSGLVIEKTPDGKFYLVIANVDEVSADLTHLERKLYAYAITEGYDV